MAIFRLCHLWVRILLLMLGLTVFQQVEAQNLIKNGDLTDPNLLADLAPWLEASSPFLRESNCFRFDEFFLERLSNVPEPFSVALLGMAVALGVLVRHNRRAGKLIYQTGWVAACLFMPLVAQAQLQPGNVITKSVPLTTFKLQLEEIVRIPNSAPGAGTDNQWARIEQTNASGDGTGRLFLSEQRGKMYHFDPYATNPTPTLLFDASQHVPDFRLETPDTKQAGMRGFAFHPEAFTPGAPGFKKFYTANVHSKGSAKWQTINEWDLALHPDNSLDSIDTSSRRQVLRVDNDPNGHWISTIAFNPNVHPGDSDYGKLFVEFGDGGKWRRPQNGQDRTNLLGTISRINPLQDGSNPYTIPADNPFVGADGGIREEIWAYGFRNPHKITWDTGGDGKMIISEIGQANIEEINLGVKGANYGWYEREGTYAYQKPSNRPNPTIPSHLPSNHASDNYTYPVAQYDNSPNGTFASGSTAVAGGFVYRGSKIPELYGKYLFANFGKDNEGPIYVVDVDELVLRDDFSDLAIPGADLSALHDGFLAPIQKLQLTDSLGVNIDFIDLVRDASGRSSQNRTDIRFGLDAVGEIYVTSKKDGWVRRFVATVPEPATGAMILLGICTLLHWRQRNEYLFCYHHEDQRIDF